MGADFEVVDPEFNHLVLPNAPLVKLGDGFTWLEGPAWFPDANQLLFSELPSNRILRWTEDGGIGVFRAQSDFANGHSRDRQGRLIGTSHHGRCITRTELDGGVSVLASHYRGRRLNGPNDLVCRSDSSIWFTDPHYGINTDYEGGKQTPELPPAVYRLDGETGVLSAVAEDFDGPNGLAFSPDESLLYIAESGKQFDQEPKRMLRVFDVAGDRLENGRDFFKVAPGFTDGLRVDEAGRVWSSAGDGVHCIGPDGRLLGRIKVPFTVSNLEFGGRNRARLFICASHTLFAIYTNTRGAERLGPVGAPFPRALSPGAING